MDDLHELPKFQDAISYIYIEHGKIDRHENTIACYDKEGMTSIPASSLSVLMLGPGTRITHRAVQMLAENDCLAIWCGEENVRFYAYGTGGTRSSKRLLYQAYMASDETRRLEVVKRMYRLRFSEIVEDVLNVEQLRGMEGRRVRDAYARWSKETGVPWEGRSYDRGNWNAADPVNKALSCGNSCLYGLCHAAILASGFSPAIGFIHTGKQLSFVYDIADLYKTEITIPLAFKTALENPPQIERHVRLHLRDLFRENKLLQRIIPDIKKVLGGEVEDFFEELINEDPALPADLWTPSWEKEDEN